MRSIPNPHADCGVTRPLDDRGILIADLLDEQRLENYALDAEIAAEDWRRELRTVLNHYREARAEARRARARYERYMFVQNVGETFGPEAAAVVAAHTRV